VLGSVATRPEVAAPRVYVSRRDGEIVLLDGLPLDPVAGAAVHDARTWHGDWAPFRDRLEGRFVAVRAAPDGSSLELLTDPGGISQVYVHEADGASVVSNSPGLIARALGLTALDETGAATFLATDVLSGRHTLRAGVDVLRPAQSWTWRKGDRRWARATYWHATAAATGPGVGISEDLVSEVVRDIAAVSRAAAAVNGSIFSAITAGKDSRMLATVLMTHAIPTTFWTKGDATSLDAIVAQQVAERHGLPHVLANRPTVAEAGVHAPTATIAERWPELSAAFVAQTDGIASLINVGNIAGQPERVERIAVTLTGLCGELARYANEHPLLYGSTSVSRAIAYLVGQIVDHRRGLVTRDGFHLARAFLRSALTEVADDGVPGAHLAKAWTAVDKYHRWASMNPIELAQTEDKVLPFMTRGFIAASLGLRPELRFQERLHRAVIARLVPDLEHEPPMALPWRGELPVRTSRERVRDWLRPRLPYDVRTAGARWRDRRRRPVVYRSLTVPYDESSWIEANLPGIREIVMSQPSSSLWRVINRAKMERLLDPATPADERRLNEFALFAAIGMFQYAQIEQSVLAETVADPPILAAGAA
jgi:asparagine synthetase B (glutamine-hydrolysing)